jgi:collagen type VII alpha
VKGLAKAGTALVWVGLLGLLGLGSWGLGVDPPVAGMTRGWEKGGGTGAAGITGARGATGGGGTIGARGILGSNSELSAPRFALDTVEVGIVGGITGLIASSFGTSRTKSLT